MKRLAERMSGRGWVMVGIACALFAAAGCAKQADHAAPQGAPAAPSTMAAAGRPITISWDPQANCANFDPKSETVNVGAGINFNSSVAQADTVSAPAGCFSANDTTFVVARGNSPTVTAYRAGSYQLRFSLVTCSAVSGGTGPNIIIGDGGH